jgi:hypothetical protein
LILCLPKIVSKNKGKITFSGKKERKKKKEKRIEFGLHTRTKRSEGSSG